MSHLMPSYWVLGRCGQEPSEVLGELQKNWEEILLSSEIRPTGQNLDALQRLSPLAGYVFLSYAEPFPYLLPGPSEVPVLQFDTEELVRRGAFTTSGVIWDDLEADAAAICFERYGVDRDPVDCAELDGSFRERLKIRLRERFAARSIRGRAAIDYLAVLSEADRSNCIELYHPGPLLLRLAIEWQVPKSFEQGETERRKLI